MTNHLIEKLNTWSPVWSEAMIRSLIEGMVMLGLVALLLAIGRRKMSSGFVHVLFLLVSLKVAASAISPWIVSVQIPSGFTRAPVRVSVVDDSAPLQIPKAHSDHRIDMGETTQFAPSSSFEPSSESIEVSVRPAWTSWLMLAWAAIVVGLFARFIASHLRFARSLRDEPSIDPTALPSDPILLAKAAGLKRPIPLVLTDRVSSPAVWGLLRPRVLIPGEMLRELSRDQFTWILLHEFAHIARKDMWFLLIQRVVQLVFFFNPSIWVANRLAEVYREFACDESALARGGVSRRACGEGFLTIVERACRPRDLAAPMALGLFSPYALFRKRLARLLDETLNPSARLSRSAVVALLVIALIAALRVQVKAQPQAPAQAVSAEARSEATQRSIEVTVLEASTGKPMPGVRVESRVDAEEKAYGTTDSSGWFRVRVPNGDFTYLHIKVGKDTFVPVSYDWRLQGPTAAPLPEKYTFTLEPGTKISGRVQNEEGEPIKEAEVFVIVPVEQRAVMGSAPDIRDFSTKTDAAGRWECNIIPANATQAIISEFHPDYVRGKDDWVSSPSMIKELRAGSYTHIMKKGLVVSGVVRDQNGQTIAGASVANGRERLALNNLETKTNAQGEFRFAHVAPGPLVLSVQAKGHAPELQEIVVEPKMEPVTFSLGPPHSVRGRVIDVAGKPIAGAWVTADEWRGYRSLAIKVIADADGRFQIDDLPDSPVEFQFYKEGFMNLPGQRLAPSPNELIVTMKRPLIITGTVTDAATGKSIDNFMLLEGDDPVRDSAHWDRQRARRLRGGRYVRSFDWPVPRVRGLRIEAEGYLPAVSRSFSFDEGTVTYDFNLTKGVEPTRPAISGIVLLPDGKPAENAEVALALKSRGIHIQQGRPIHPEKYPMLRTGPDGRFAFEPQTEEAIVMAFHDQGIGEMTETALADSPDHEIRLRKWGRVEGTLRIGTKPGGNEVISLSPRSATRMANRYIYVSYQYNAPTDRWGRFVIERVVPGTAQIYREITLSAHRVSSSTSKNIEVKSDETAQIQLGGTGRPVIGRFVKPADSSLPIDWTQTRHRLQLKAPPVKPLRGATKEERAEEYRKWLETDEGKAYREYEKNRHSYGFRIEEDGSFRIDDVIDGTYELFVRVEDTPANRRRALAEAEKTVVVPEMETGQSVEPLDLGTIELGPPLDP